MASRRDLDLNLDAGRPAEPAVCCVCFEEVIYGGGRSTARLQCNHEFHLDCIGSEFNARRAMRCPNCRQVADGEWRYADGLTAQQPDQVIQINAAGEPTINGQDYHVALQEHYNHDGVSAVNAYLHQLVNQTMANIIERANAMRANASPSSSTAAHNALSHQTFEPANPENPYVFMNIDPNAHAPSQQSLENPLYCPNHGIFETVYVPGIIRGTVYGPQNHSAAYTSSSAQNGRLVVLDSNSPGYHDSDHHYYPYHQQNVSVEAVSVPVPAGVARDTLNGPRNHSAAYSYFAQYGTLDSVTQPRTSMPLRVSPNPTEMPNIHNFLPNYRPDPRSTTNSIAYEELHLQYDMSMFQNENPPSRVMRHPGQFGVSDTDGSTSLTRRSVYHRPPTPYYRPENQSSSTDGQNRRD